MLKLWLVNNLWKINIFVGTMIIIIVVMIMVI